MLGYDIIDKFEHRVFMSNVAGNFSLHRQVQLIDIQKAFVVSHVPKVVGYDGDEDPLNVPKNVKLDTCAWTVLCMAITKRFCAAFLQDAIYKHNWIGDMEPKLFLYHDEVLNQEVMIYAPTNADRRRVAMQHKGLWKWYGMARALMLTPNRQCWEAVLKWIVIDGAKSGYCLKIHD